MSYFKANMHQIRFPLGLRPRPRCRGAYSALPDSLAAHLRRSTSKGRGGKAGGKGEGKGKMMGKRGKGGARPPDILAQNRACFAAVVTLTRVTNERASNWVNLLQVSSVQLVCCKQALKACD